MKDYETIESGMTFGPYDKNDVFRIEKSELYQKVFIHDLRTLEFVIWHNENLVFLEAKTSTPDYRNTNESDEKRKNIRNSSIQ